YDVYDDGRQDFEKVLGIDPWGPGCCYDCYLFEKLELIETPQPIVLGINSGQGSNPLKVKELYKEKKHNLNTVVYNVTNQENYLEDLRGVSDYVRYEENLSNIFKKTDENFPKKFHYIIIDTPVVFLNYKQLIENCLKYLTVGGYLCALFTDNQEAQIRKAFPKADYVKKIQNWLILKSCQ
ncbi:MAG: hypothetical protein LBC86_05655, partial [Oscillospiraceae bacterium]|nr:hypothetical protein [Oscillospiraceae bacterium]